MCCKLCTLIYYIFTYVLFQYVIFTFIDDDDDDDDVYVADVDAANDDD